MKALIVYGSPGRKHSASYRLGSSFGKGLTAAGFAVDEIVVYDHEIRHCLGCRSCWSKTPGECVQQDPMRAFLERQKKAEVLVLATPLYFYTVPGMMKDYIDRQMPLFLDSFLKAMGRIPKDAPVWPDGVRVVLVSPCGFPERENFDALTLMMKKIYGRAFVADLLVPFASEISEDRGEAKFAGLYEMIRTIGEKFGRTGEISSESRKQFEAATTPDMERIRRMRGA